MALRGSLKEMSLTSLISVNCNELSCSRLRVQANGREAVLFFEDGNLVHATSGSQEGEQVVYELLSWDEGEFELESGAPATKHTIHTPWSSLLLDAMARLDEHTAGALPQADSAGTAPPSAHAGTVPPSTYAGTVLPEEGAATPSSHDPIAWPAPEDAQSWPQARTAATEPSAVDNWTQAHTLHSGATLAMTQAAGQSTLSHMQVSPSQGAGTAPSAMGRSESRRPADGSGPRLVAAYDEAAPATEQTGPRLVRPHPGPRLVAEYDDAEPAPGFGEMLPVAEWAAPEPAEATGATPALLDRICRLEGVDGALLVARDGTLLGHRREERTAEGQTVSAAPLPRVEDAAQQAAAVAAFVGNAAKEMGEALHLGALVSGMVAMGAGRTRILLLEQPEYFVGLLLGQHASPSLVTARATPLLMATSPEDVLV